MPNKHVQAAAEGLPTDIEFLNRLMGKLKYADSLVHGLWMAGASISNEPEKNAIRDFAHLAGEQIGDALGEVRKCLKALGGDE